MSAWAWQYHRDLFAGAAALVAAVCGAIILAEVLTRLDRGGRESVGRLLGLVVALVIITLVSVTNAFLRIGRTATTLLGPTSDDEPVLTQIIRALHPADYAYIAALAIVAVSATIWRIRRHRASETPPDPNASVSLLWAGTLLLVALWIVQRGVDPLDLRLSTGLQRFGAMIGAGVLTMAIIQGLRTLLPLRGVFHAMTLERWIDDALAAPLSREETEEARRARNRATRRSIPFDRKAFDRRRLVLDSLTRLASGPVSSDRYALLDLPIEQLCGQIAAGADRLLDAPFADILPLRGKFEQSILVPDALLALTAGGTPDIVRYLKLAGTVTADKAVSAEAETEAAVDGESGPLTPADRQEYVRLRASLSQRIQRNIDGLQIATTFWWRRVLRGIAFTSCGVLGLSVFSGRINHSVLCAIVGGFVATASRDLIAVIEKARR